jgi:hypothetical protein
MEFWNQNFGQSFSDSGKFMEGAYFIPAVIIFVVGVVLAHIFRGRDSMREWFIDGLMGAAAIYPLIRFLLMEFSSWIQTRCCGLLIVRLNW